MRTVNLGILAHVDAGKTSLTERLLHDAGVIDTLGSVDAGTTQTDSLALERQRGITIKSAVVSFAVGDTTVNLIDTPGHPDFVAEVERVLAVLDGAVLVISAVEGVQSQTRVLFGVLRRLGIPTLLFVNKTDRSGADVPRVLRQIADRLTGRSVPADAGPERLADVLATHDDAFLAAYVHDETALPYRKTLRGLVRRAELHPVYTGSARTGAGVAELVAGITELLPADPGAADGPVSGTVFKVVRGLAAERIAYVRLFGGTLRVRDRLPGGRVTGITVFDHGRAVRANELGRGRIGQVWGLGDVRIGDPVGVPPASTDQQFAPPTLETVVVPSRAGERGALHTALERLAEQDPLINLRLDELSQDIAVSLYGEVQKEVIGQTLADEFGIDVTFRETTTIHIERPIGVGTALDVIKQDGNPFLATIGLRIEPGPVDSGVVFVLGIELGSLPLAFIRAVEETVHATLRRGGLAGWQVTDCVVTMTRSGYWARQSHAHGTFDKSMSSTAGDFRGLTPIVLRRALERAGTAVLEPIHRFHIDLPAGALPAVLPALARLGAVPRSSVAHGGEYAIDGDIPAARVRELERQLPGRTGGEGLLASSFDHYQELCTQKRE